MDDATPHHRFDPQRSGVENATTQKPRSAQVASVFYVRHQRRQPRAVRRGAHREKADQLLTSDSRWRLPRRERRAVQWTRPATTIRHRAWSASRRSCWPSTPPTTNAIRPSSASGREIKRVKHAVRAHPASEDTRDTAHGMAKLWKHHLAEL